MSVRRAQHEIDSTEFTEWMAYYRLEPWGDAVADLRHGVLSSLIANANRDSKSRPQPFSPEDFIYWTADDRDDVPESSILFDDPESQTEAVIAKLFGNTAVFRYDAMRRD
jgi:hypothetical protein